MKAFLILENGQVFEGTSIGATKDMVSELVFNTSITGYLEVLTNPANAGKAVVMTYPLIGNYGICYEDMESDHTWADGIIVRELSRVPSNFRSEDTIQNFLINNNVTGIAGIDTRALTKLLRDNGSMKGMITTNEAYNLDEILPQLKAFESENLVAKVTDYEKYVLEGEGSKIAYVDYGSPRHIVKDLNKRGNEVAVYPAGTKADEILAGQPDGIIISDGPGCPCECDLEEIKKLFNSGIPMMAYGLGHNLVALANGGSIEKMVYGHRGGNHPVKNTESGKVYISSQNHGYIVVKNSVSSDIAKESFVNVNDNTNEGYDYIGKNVFTIQFIPEICDYSDKSNIMYDRFEAMMKKGRD